MEYFKFCSMIFIILLTRLSFSQSPIISPSPGNSTVCPGEVTYYSVIPGSNYSACGQVTWSVSNGSFSSTTLVSTTTGLIQNSIIVYWNDTPNTGTLTATSSCSEGTLTTSSSYAIRSLTGRTLTNPRANQTLLYCGTGTINLAVDIMYLNNTGAGTGVDQQRADGYEWSLPTGWSFSGGSSTETVNIYPDNGCRGGTVTVKGYMNCSSGKKYSSSSSISINRPTPTLTITAPGLTASSCGSGQQVTFSVSPVLGCVSDYNWVFSGPNAQTPSGWLATPTSSGTNNYITVQSSGGAADAGSVRVTVTLACGTQLVSSPFILSFAAPAISTSPAICSGGTNVIMTNVAPSVAVNWSVSNNMNIVSGQGTSSAVMQAINSSITDPGTIDATVSCANTSIAQKPVWVGLPRYTLVDGPQVVSAGTEHFYSAMLWNSSTPSFTQQGIAGNGFEWSFPLTSTNAGWSCVNCDGEYTWITPGAASSYVSLRVQNNCGYSERKDYEVFVQQVNCPPGGCEEPFIVYPNPTSETLVVALTDDTASGQGMAKSSSVTLTDLQGLKVYESQSDAKQVAIPVDQLKNGIYHVQIKSNRQTLQKQVVIKH